MRVNETYSITKGHNMDGELKVVSVTFEEVTVKFSPTSAGEVRFRRLEGGSHLSFVDEIETVQKARAVLQEDGYEVATPL